MEKSPGQKAYEAWRSDTPHAISIGWDDLGEENQRGWNAAAAAVLAKPRTPGNPNDRERAKLCTLLKVVPDASNEELLGRATQNVDEALLGVARSGQDVEMLLRTAGVVTVSDEEAEDLSAAMKKWGDATNVYLGALKKCAGADGVTVLADDTPVPVALTRE